MDFSGAVSPRRDDAHVAPSGEKSKDSGIKHRFSNITSQVKELASIVKEKFSQKDVKFIAIAVACSLLALVALAALVAIIVLLPPSVAVLGMLVSILVIGGAVGGGALSAKKADAIRKSHLPDTNVAFTKKSKKNVLERITNKIAEKRIESKLEKARIAEEKANKNKEGQIDDGSEYDDRLQVDKY